MKIYILSCDKQFQPKKSPFNYPPHTKDHFVEQDFNKYLLKNRGMITQNPTEADWHFLPIYWTRWHLIHNYAKTGLEELQREVDKSILDDNKTFTICQYDDGPVVNLGKTTIFLSSRKMQEGIDIPLLCLSHRKPFFRSPKKYLASFIGRLSTHYIRQEMAECLKNREDVYISDGDKGTEFFVKKTLESYIALCPRGYGGSSFRIFEAMQLGVVPFLISDIDTRPFKKFISWNEVSLFTNSVRNMNDIFNSLNQSVLLKMGQNAAKLYKEKLAYQKWCQYVIRELRELK